MRIDPLCAMQLQSVFNAPNYFIGALYQNRSHNSNFVFFPFKIAWAIDLQVWVALLWYIWIKSHSEIHFYVCAKTKSWTSANAEKEIRSDKANLKFNDFDLAWVKGKLFFQEKDGCGLHANVVAKRKLCCKEYEYSGI